MRALRHPLGGGAQTRCAGITLAASPPVRGLFLIVVTTLALTLDSSTTEAQYFGRNKVQYRTFAFEVLRTDHFDVYFYPSEREGAEIVSRLAERWHARLSSVFGGELRGRQPVVLYASQPDFQQTNVLAGQIGEGTGGVTESIRRRIVLPLAGSLAATDHVLGHELVHAFQFDITTRVEADNARRQPGAERLPLWFVEGMAEYLSIGPADVATAMWLRDAVRHETLPSIRRLNDPRYFPYRWGHAVWAYLGGSFGDWIVRDLLKVAASTGDVNAAFEEVLHMTEKEVSAAWHAATLTAYRGRIDGLEEPTAYGDRLTTANENVTYEVGPALSPDGTKVAFLSERDLLTVDLFVADVSSRTVVHRVTSATADAHTTSLQFIASAGAWDAPGRRLAYAAIRRGRASLVVYDDERRRVDRRFELPVDEAFTPTWSPNGTAIAFSGSSGGMTDLFVLSLEDGRVARLTEDVFADMQPAWSPDGTRLVFVTDRDTTRLETLAPGRLHLAVMDVGSRVITNLTSSVPGGVRAPQWETSDVVWCVSDETGVANLYRLSLAQGRAVRASNLGGGMTGVTATSPALSVARTGRLAFSVYEEGRHRIFVGALPSVPDAWAASAKPVMDFAKLPGANGASGLSTLLADAASDLPAGGTGEPRKYRPRLGMDFFAQPSVGVAVGRYGTAVGGGVMFGMSDMLGDHNLVAAFDTAIAVDRTFSASDIGLYGSYQNLKRRWNWGLAAEQLPYRTGAYAVGTRPSPSGAVLVEDEVLYRQVSRGLSGVVSYPFDEGQRLEVGTGLKHYDFERVTWTTVSSLSTGERLSETRERVTQPGITLGQTSVAFVRDRAFFGATGPVAGERWRFEVTPTAGTLRYSGVLADYRRYLMPVSFYTVAARVLHYGRYGSGADDSRLLPLFLGYPEFVRGYDAGSFTSADCDLEGRCSVFDRLLGSRMLVANLELRFPLLRPFGTDRRMYGPVPVEVALFADAGVAWEPGTRPRLFGGSRDGVESAGVSFRVNILGFAIGQFSLVRPFSRPSRGWDWQFSLTPGF